jgi:uncharacterized protein
MIAFLDASAIIYLTEGAAPFAERLNSNLANLERAHGPMDTAVSRLSWMECRIRPARDNDLAAVAAYDSFFSRTDLIWVELTRDVVELATAIRIKHGLRTPDALQAASCLQLGTSHVFLTGDGGFKKVTDLNARILA